MARLEAPVMNTRRRAPAASASSTAYWISGLSTTGSISLGIALVAGRKRVPRPATGNTALRIFIGSLRALFNGERGQSGWRRQAILTRAFPALVADFAALVRGV